MGRLYGLPDPRTTRLGRRRGGASNGPPDHEYRLAAGLALPFPQQLAPFRRHLTYERGRGYRIAGWGHHPRLVAALGAWGLQPLSFQRRPRTGEGIYADH